MTRRAPPGLLATLATLAVLGCRGRAPPPPLECPILDCADDAATIDAGAPGEGEGEGVDGGVALALPRNLILFLGDGMGAEQQRAARIFKNGGSAPLAFEALPHAGCVHTTNASGGVTDSAAAATAMATGHKVDNGVIALQTPGDGSELSTVLELLQARGMSAGLVTTATPLTDATPAAFAAHAASRYDDETIAAAYLHGSRPRVLMGAPSTSLTADLAAAAGYETASTADELAELAARAAGSAAPWCGVFDGAEPSLATRTRAALDELTLDPEGFFLLVEHEGTDNGGHANDLAMVVDAVLELEAAVEVGLAFAAERDDTLILVTADHETGGLTVTESAPSEGVLPRHTFARSGHTGADVPIYATGPGAEAVTGCFENTRIFSLLTDTAD